MTCECGTPMVYVEIWGVYDGALFLGCPQCGATKARFAKDTHPRLFALGEKYRATWKP